MADSIEHEERRKQVSGGDSGSVWDRIGSFRGRRLDMTVVALSVLMTAGIVFDFRNHVSGISFEEEGFFTPEHVFFYTAFLLIALTLFSVTYYNRRQGASWVGAVPDGYRLGILGVFVFGFGGFGDYVWHSLFGFEANVEALTSPTHLLLAAGALLFVSSPLRATWYAEEKTRGKGLVPAIVSATLAVLVLLLFTLYVNPLNDPIPAEANSHGAIALGLAQILIFTAIMVGSSLMLVRRFELPPGTFTFLFGATSVASTFPELDFEFVPAVVVAGVFADILYRVTLPSLERIRAFRLFAVSVPLVMFSLYYVTISVVSTMSVVWTIHVWAGSVALAGATGLLLSYLMVPSVRNRAAASGDERGGGS
jgi:hypothetical protein